MPRISRLLLLAIPSMLLNTVGPGPRAEITLSPELLAQGTDEAGTQLVETFARFCLDRFPNRADLAQGEGAAMQPMKPEAVRQFLHADPGRGWFYQPAGQGSGTYAVTVEDPPYKACAVRRMYSDTPRFGMAYQLRLGAWAAAEQRGAFPPPRDVSQTRDNMQIRAAVQQLPARPNQPAEVFMAFTTAYRSGQVEIRLVRQIPDPRLLNR